MRRIALYVIVLWLWLWLAPLTPAQSQSVVPKFRFASVVTTTDAAGKTLRRDWYSVMLEKITVNGVVYNRLRMQASGTDWVINNCGTYKAFSASGETYTVIGRETVTGNTMKLVVTKMATTGPAQYSLQYTVTDLANKIIISRSTGTLSTCDAMTWLVYQP